jgi:hypothetical protein
LPREGTKEKEGHMFRYKTVGFFITSAGYNAQYAQLEVEFRKDSQVWVYLDVPEEIWYEFKNSASPDRFFCRFIQGCYKERRIH